MKKKFDWLRGRVSYADENGEIRSFHGEFSWNLETRVLFLRETKRVVILPDERLVQIVMDRKDFDSAMTKRMFESPPYTIDQNPRTHSQDVSRYAILGVFALGVFGVLLAGVTVF